MRMAIETFDGISPDIDDSAFVAQSADVIGRVSIGEEASVWYNTTLRGTSMKLLLVQDLIFKTTLCCIWLMITVPISVNS